MHEHCMLMKRRATLLRFCVVTIVVVSPQAHADRRRASEVAKPYDPIAVDTWANKGFGDDDVEDEGNIIEPAEFLWQKLDVCLSLPKAGICCVFGDPG